MKKTSSGMGEKNRAAVELGKLRAAQMTFEERSNAGKSGGAARAASLTKAQRVAAAKKAAAARWGDPKPKPKKKGRTAK